MGIIKRLYERLWKRVGGRAWTEIIRDDQKNSALAYMLVFLALGVLVAKLCGKRWWWMVVGFMFGVLVGHLWW